MEDRLILGRRQRPMTKSQLADLAFTVEVLTRHNFIDMMSAEPGADLLRPRAINEQPRHPAAVLDMEKSFVRRKTIGQRY